VDEKSIDRRGAPTPVVPVDTTVAAASTPRDRRRPGRSGSVNPALIPLLRRAPPQANPDISDASADAATGNEADFFIEPADDLSAAKGILLGILLVIPFWGLVGCLVWWIAR